MRSLRGGAAPMNRIIMLSRTFTEIHIVIYAKRIQLECVCKCVCLCVSVCACTYFHFIFFDKIFDWPNANYSHCVINRYNTPWRSLSLSLFGSLGTWFTHLCVIHYLEVLTLAEAQVLVGACIVIVESDKYFSIRIGGIALGYLRHRAYLLRWLAGHGYHDLWYTHTDTDATNARDGILHGVAYVASMGLLVRLLCA